MPVASSLADTPIPQVQRRHIAAAAIGNAFEVYDFTTYGYFAIFIAHAFFPAGSELKGLLLSLATFGVGFFARPVGALVLGAYGDRTGRRPALMLSLTTMGLGVLAMAAIPPYASVGIAAPLLLVLTRLVQGFALGGEIGASTAFMIEIAPQGQRGFYGGWQLASQGIATLVAGLIGVTISHFASQAQMQSWGWRIPFLIGALVLPVGIFIRRDLPETHSQGAGLTLATATNLLRSHARVAVLGFFIVAGTTIPFYLLAYMTTYAVTTLRMGTTVALGSTVVLGLCNIVFSLMGGSLSDRIGRKPVMIWPRLVLIAVVYPTYWLMVRHASGAMLLGATAFLAALNQLSSSVGITVITEVLPKPIRAAASGVVYALAVAIFGGTTQFVIAWMVGFTGDKLAPAWYLAISTLMAVVAMLFMPETSERLRQRGS